MTEYDLFIKMLKRANYKEVHDVMYNNIGPTQYMIDRSIEGIIFVSLGCGKVGNKGAYTNFDFDSNTGEFLDHASRANEYFES